MAFENGIIPEEIQGSYFDKPVLDVPEQDASLFDLVHQPFLPMGGGGFGASYQEGSDPIQSKLDAFAAAPATPSMLSQPTYFDWDRSQADRYVNARQYKQLGFNPNIGQDNEYNYGRTQTWGDVWGNGLTGMFKLAGNTFIEGWKGWAHIADAIGSADLSKLTGTPEQLMEQDKLTKDIMNKYAIFETPESEKGIFNRSMFGTMLQQSGFALGTIAQFASEELLTFGLSTQFSLAKLGLKEASWMGKIVKQGEVIKDIKKLGDSVWKSRTFAEGMVQGARKFVPYFETGYQLQKYGKAGAGALQLTAIGVGGLRRVLSEANMAMTEARMEAAGTYGELYTKLYDEELFKTGQAPSASVLENIKEKSMAAAQDNFKVNTGILMVMNRLQFDNLFTKFKFGRSVLGESGGFADDVIRVSGKAKVGGKDLTKLYTKGTLGTLSTIGKISADFGGRKAAWEATKSIGRNVFKWEASEGIQELFQEGSNIAIQDYYYDLYHGYKGGLEKSVMKGVDAQADVQGMKTFLMGALTGRLLSPINFAVGKAKLYGSTTAKQRLERKQSIKDATKQINDFFSNPKFAFPEHIANVKVQNKAAQNMEEAIANRDAYVFHNNKDSAFAKMFSSAIKTNMAEAVIDTLKGYGESFNDQDFKEAFGMEASETNRASVKDFFGKIADEAIGFHDRWKNLKERYADAIKVDIYQEGSESRKVALMAQRALDEALEMLATNDHKARKTAIRAIALQQKMSGLPTIGGSAATAFRNLGVMQNTDVEIDILKKEIEGMEANPSKDEATKNLIKTKKQQLKALEEWKENHPALKSLGRKEKRKYKKAKKAFVNYMNSKNKESNIDILMQEDKLDEIYGNLLDYIELNNDNKEYVDAYNIVANPIQFVNIHRRIMDAMQQTALKKFTEALEEMSREARGKPPVPAPGESKTHTVVVQPDGKFSVVSPKKNVVAKDIETEDEAKAIAEELDKILAQTPPPAAGGSTSTPDAPENLGKDAIVRDKAEGIYLIEDIDKDGNKYYYIVDKENKTLVNIELDDENYPTYDANMGYDEYDEAKKIFDALLKQIAKDKGEYMFDGKKIAAGTILVDDKGRKFKVVTKGKPLLSAGSSKITILPLQGSTVTTIIENLKGYRLESEIETETAPKNPNAFRLLRNNELLRIYPHQNTLATGQREKREDAEKRLNEFLLNTPQSVLLSGLSIIIKRNTNLPDPYLASYANGENANPNLQVQPEPYSVQVLYNGQPIGYVPHYNHYKHIDSTGRRSDLDIITKEQFLEIFNPEDKNVDKEIEKFKKNYRIAEKVYSTIINELKTGDTATLDSAKVAELFYVNSSSGEYAYIDKEEDKVAFDQLNHNTINGVTYIIDRRKKYKKGDQFEIIETDRFSPEASLADQEVIKKKVQQARKDYNGNDKLNGPGYGRYVGVVEMPNGNIRFINLTAATMDKLTLDDFAKKINETSKKLKENNTKEAVDPNTKKPFLQAIDPFAANDINQEISETLYIALKTIGMAGMNVTLIVTPTGNIKVDFGIRYRDSAAPIKAEIYLYESEKDKSVPFNLTDFNDLITRINRGIDDYNANPSNASSTDKSKLKNIGVRLLPSSFKRSLMDNAQIEEYRQLLSSVGPSVTKNPNLTITAKYKENSPSNPLTLAGVSEGADEAPIPENILAQQAEIKRKLEEAKKKREEEERKKREASGAAKSKTEQIAELRQAYDDRSEQIQTEKMNTINPKTGKNYTRVEVYREFFDASKSPNFIEDPKKGDPRILEILQQIAALQQGTANKIADELTTDEVVDINEFAKWVEENLPEFISVEDLKLMTRKMKQNGVTVGMFYMHMNNINNQLQGRIAVGEKSPFKYHEAFHAVFRMLLTDEKIDELLGIAKRELRESGANIADLKKKLLESKPEFYSQFSDIELEERVYEEYIADKFDAWKRDIKTPTSAANKGFFRKLWDFILGLFKAFRNSDSLENFFMKIEKGKYRKSQIVSNRFTNESLISVTQPALKVIKIGTDFIENEYGEMEEVPRYLGEEEGNVLAATVAAIFHRKTMEAGLNSFNEDILDEVIADYANLYDSNLNPYYDSDEFLGQYEKVSDLQKILKRIKDRYKIFTNPELIQIFKDAAMVHIKLMGYKEQLDEEEFDKKVDEYGDRSSTDNRRETYSIGGYGSLSRELRLYLSTVVEEKADEFGNTMFINDKGEKTNQTIIEAANANVLYQGILKAVAGSVTEEQILERLYLFSQNNPEANKFWNKFSKDVELIYEDGKFIDIGNKKQANLFQAVMKGFSQFSVDYLFNNKDIGKRKSVVLEANRRGAAKNQFSIWYNAYENIFVEKFYQLDPKDQNKFIDDRTKSLVYITNWFGSFFNNPAILDAKIQETIIGLKNDLGISLSPLYLKYSYLKSLPAEYFNDLTKPGRAEQLRIINAFEGVTPLTKDDALQIANVIKSRKNPFGDNLDPSKLLGVEEKTTPRAAHESLPETKENPELDVDSKQEERDVDDDIDGARGRLTNIAEGNAVFDEQVASTSHKNAEGEMVFSHQLPTFNLVRGAQLRSEDFREKLKKNKFLETNFLLNSPLFQSIAGNFKVVRSDGIKDSSLTETEDGKYKEDKRLNVNQNKGTTYGSMSPREFLINLLDLYGRNKTYTIATETNRSKPFMTSTVLMGVLEASNTGDFAGELPVIKSVEFDKQGNVTLTSEAKNALFNEVMREYDRITRVQTEITTGKYEKGIIEGYHTGDPDNKKNPGMRGLRFIKMKNMLGDKAAQLEEAAKQGLELTADEKAVIYRQIEEYWLGDNGEVSKFIEDLIKAKIIVRDKDGKFQNRLVGSFVFSGFWQDGKPSETRNSLLNLSTTSFEYNISQIVINNYINTLSVRQLFIGDAAENYKDDQGIDEVKRNRGLNASGPSSYSAITAPQLGINHANKTSYVVTYNDAQYDGKYKGKKDSKEDGQMRMTVKALRYTLFGFGRLNQAQAELLDKIERGDDVKTSDIFGMEYTDPYGIKRQTKGSIEFNAQTNSIKLVYDDGQNYIKISSVILSKQLTSIKENGVWVARPGNEELHNLREKLEEYESRNSTITFAVPKSGSKGLKINVAKDMNSIADENFIEHDNNFWRLQLENPSNKLKITDPTQAKQLILSEQERDLVVTFRGENMKLGDVIDQYLSDTEQRVINKYTSTRNTIFDVKGAFRELKKSIKQNEVTPKLGEFLNRAVGILEATGTDPQTIQFFTPLLNEKTGEYSPKYDLNHPITLEKFTQLFLAYFSRDVMNEKVPGHSVALMSNYGMKVVKRVIELDENGQPKRWEVITRRQYELDRKLLAEARNAKKWNNEFDREFSDLKVGDLYIDDLRHNVPEYDEKGNIIGYFTEFMTAPHFKEDMKEYLRTGKLSTELLKAFGVRIPSQDKHSFTTLKLVDFLPANYGSTGVFPHELIEISGADFDIDKLYMHIKDSYTKNGKRVAYGTAVTDKEKFAEYVYYMVKKDRQVKSKMAELKKITAVYDESEDKYEIDGDIEPVTIYEDIEDLSHDLFSSKVSAQNMMEIIALKELGLPSTVDEYVKYVKTKGELNNGLLNNRILDAKIKLLNNENMVKAKNGKMPVAFQIAETKPLEDVIESFIERFPILRDILIEGSADVDSIRGQYYSFKNNKEGARNIGPAVNAMLVYALMNTYKVPIRTKNSKGNPLFVLTIDGKDFDTYGNARSWNSETKDNDGERIAYVISAIVSAMTDNAKERLAARLGLNINAIGVVSNMVALGVPLETAIMFNLQPSVREFYDLISLTNNNIKTSQEREIFKSQVGDSILKKINARRSKKEEERLLFPITTQLLEDNIKTVGNNPDVDYSIFSTFFDFYKQTEAFSSVAKIMKLTQGLGTSNEDIDAIDEVEEKLGFNMDENDFLLSSIPFDIRQVLKGTDPSKPHNNIIASLIRIKNEIKELQKSIMIERSYLYKRLYSTIFANLNVNSKEKEAFEKTLKKDIIAYLGIKSYMNLLKTTGKSVKLDGLDNALIYDAAALQKGEDYEDIITAVQRMREANPDNAFLKFINAVPAALKDIQSGEMFRNPKGKFGINTLLVNTWASLDLARINKIEDGLMELYSNAKTRPYVYKLFNYLLVKDGGQFKSGSFIRFMPPAMFKELLDATGNALQLLRYDNAITNDEAFREVFGSTAMEIFNEFTKLYTTNANSTFNVKGVYPKGTPPENIERIPGYLPEVFKYNDKQISIDLFRGIRKKELQLVTDEQGNEFMMEVVNTGSFSEDELKKLEFNRELLKANGFNIIKKVNQEGKNRYYVALPYTVKILVDDNVITGKEYAYYRLSKVSKTKQDPNSPGIGNFIMEAGDDIALGSAAIYEKFEPEGAKDQWKLGGLTGEMPTQKILRDRYGKKKTSYDDVDYDPESEIERLEAQLEGLPEHQLQEPVQDLQKDWGIFIKMMGSKITYYKLEKGKEVPYDPKGAKSPQELLDRLNKEYEQSGGAQASGLKNAYTEKVTPASQTQPEVPDDIDLSGQSEAATNKLKAMLAAKKGLSSEVKDQKNEKDKGCS